MHAYDLIGMSWTRCDDSKEWRVGIEGYRLFRKDWKGSQGGGVALYVNDQLQIMEFHLGVDEAD